MRPNVDHEKLEVYQESLKFVAWAAAFLGATPKHLAVHNPLSRASTSIPGNIAEGNGKYTSADPCRFFDIARGSILDCATCLDVLRAKTRIKQGEADSGKLISIGIASLLVGRIRSLSPRRGYGKSAEYNVNSTKNRG